MRRPWYALATLALVAGASTGCGSAKQTETVTTAATTAAASTNGTSVPSPTAPSAAAPEALAFTANLVDGGPIDLRTLAGKPVAFWFWAPT